MVLGVLKFVKGFQRVLTELKSGCCGFCFLRQSFTKCFETDLPDGVELILYNFIGFCHFFICGGDNGR